MIGQCMRQFINFIQYYQNEIMSCEILQLYHNTISSAISSVNEVTDCHYSEVHAYRCLCLSKGLTGPRGAPGPFGPPGQKVSSHLILSSTYYFTFQLIICKSAFIVNGCIVVLVMLLLKQLKNYL